jgi:hypothetical protein
MRAILSCVGLGAVLLLVGCKTWGFAHDRGNPPPPPRANAETPDAATLVGYLNDNARRLQSVESPDVFITARGGEMKGGLTGKLSCQKPRSLRLQAIFMGSQAVDLGSNDQEFWYWFKQGEPNYLMHCSYQDLSAGNAKIPFPFQPDWILATLGMAEYDPNAKYVLNKDNPRTLELVEQTTSPQGVPLRKVTVFSRNGAGSGRPQVIAHKLQDANGKDICAAHVADVQYDQHSGAVVPKKVKLLWPAADLEMEMTFEKLIVNRGIDRDRAAALFTRPQMNVPTYDLGRGPETPASPSGYVRRTGGFTR